MKHEDFIEGVRGLVIPRLSEAEQAKVKSAKLAYGMGRAGTRGATFYGAWKGHGQDGQPADFIEVCAGSEESVTQLAGTTIHEIAHVVVGHGAGHGMAWHSACERLGLLSILAAGTNYTEANFEPTLWAEIVKLGQPLDGQPNHASIGSGIPFVGLPTGRGIPCPMGIGTRGGTSRGKGSGSRLRLYTCDCGTKVRVASDTFDATCNQCQTVFAKPIKGGTA